jgi:ribonuclease PH
MLPGSTQPRKPRERDGKTDGRSVEIQRLIGRSLRAVTDLAALGERTITLDCDVLQADGGTRTLCITAAWVALADAIRRLGPGLPDPARSPLRDSVAAVSVGRVDGRLLVDLNYQEDAAAEVDVNVVLTGSGRYVEVQATGEEATYNRGELEELLDLAGRAVGELARLQLEALGKDWPAF